MQKNIKLKVKKCLSLVKYFSKLEECEPLYNEILQEFQQNQDFLTDKELLHDYDYLRIYYLYQKKCDFNVDCPNPDQPYEIDYKLPIPDYNEIVQVDNQNQIPFDTKQFKGELKFRFPIEHKKFIKKLVMIDSTTLISVGNDNKIILWDFYNQVSLRAYDKQHGEYNSLLLFNDIYLITGTVSLKVFKILNDSPMFYELISIQTLHSHEGKIQQIIQFDKNSIITVSMDNEVRHWIFDQKTEQFHQNENIQDFYLDEHNNYCTDAVITKDRKYLVTSDVGKQISIFDMETQQHHNVIHTNREIYENTMLILNQFQNILVTGTWRTLSFWDIDTGVKISEVHNVHSDWIQQIIQLDDEHILTVSDDKQGHVWKLQITYEEDNLYNNTCSQQDNIQECGNQQNKQQDKEDQQSSQQVFNKAKNIKNIDLEFVKSLKGNTYSILTAIIGPDNTIITGSADSNILVYH